MKYTVRSTQELAERAQAYIEDLKRGDRATVVGLSGNLGAGKTSFTQEAAKALGVTETVTSPTFVIEKIYALDASKNHAGFEKLIHIDAYRLESGHELEKLGWHEILNDPRSLILIEWPEKVAEVLPNATKMLHFTFIDEQTREIEIPDYHA